VFCLQATTSTGDGGPATLGRFGNGIRGISEDVEGGGFVVTDYTANVIRRVSASRMLSTIAGVPLGFSGSSGTGGPGTSARLNKPNIVLRESSTSVVILDTLVS
jgi:hypothetical protein